MISILMPFYNGYEFLDESISSILNQTYKKFELIVGLNGLDKQEIAKTILKLKSFKDKRIKIIVCATKGKTKTLNKLVFQAKYNYVCLIDADDCWKSDKLEKQIKFINKYDVVGSDIEYFGDKSGSPGLFLGKLTKPMFSWQNPIINSAVMIRKVHAYWDPSWEGLDDYNMWIALMKKDLKFYNVPEVLAYHRIYQNSSFNGKNVYIAKKKREELPKLTEKEIEELTKLYDEKAWLE
jgi:glycosyltransferase involved in cell wall biosynthesis